MATLRQSNAEYFEKLIHCNKPDYNTILMYKEADRLNTYKKWRCKYIDPKSLAKAGFYYLYERDFVRCAFCHIKVGQWVQGDIAMADHQKWSQDCPFVRGRNCGNIPIKSDYMLMSWDTQHIYWKYGIEIRPNFMPKREIICSNVNWLDLSKLGVHITRGPAYAGLVFNCERYVTTERRLSSFANWPRLMKPNPDELAAAGFFYNGKDNQTVCFHCGGGLNYWKDDDDPWEQHAKWFSKCNFVQLQKGLEYISEVCSKKEAVLTPGETAGLPIKSDSVSAPSTSLKPKEIPTKKLALEDSKTLDNADTLCKVCFLKEVGVVFLPCRHLAVCVDCGPALSSCAVCRKPLKATVRAYLS